MPVCRNDEMNKGGAYPKSCPSCGFGGFCTRGVAPRQGADPKYYIPVATAQAAKPIDSAKYAILGTTTIHHEGDERSRTNPGHGYPAYSESVDTFTKYDSLEKLKAAIASKGKFERFTAIRYEELKITTEVVVGIA